MYGWVWRKLPGRWPLKLLESIVLVLAICAVLVVVVFPWVEPKLPFSGNTVDDGPVATTPGTSTPTSTSAPRSTTHVPSPGEGGGELPGDG